MWHEIPGLKQYYCKTIRKVRRPLHLTGVDFPQFSGSYPFHLRKIELLPGLLSNWVLLSDITLNPHPFVQLKESLAVA